MAVRTELDELVVTHLGLMRATAARLVDYSEVDDVVQAAAMVALERGAQLADLQAFPTWIARVVQSEARRHRLATNHVVDLVGNQLADAALTPEARVLATDETRRQVTALRRLSNRDRDVLLSRHVDDEPVSSLAARHGTTPASMSTALCRARNRAIEALAKTAALLGIPVSVPHRRRRPGSSHWQVAATLQLLEVAVAAALGGGIVMGQPATPTMATTAPWASTVARMVDGPPATSPIDAVPTIGNGIHQDSPPPTPAVETAKAERVDLPEGFWLEKRDEAPDDADIEVVVYVGGEPVGVSLYTDAVEDLLKEDAPLR